MSEAVSKRFMNAPASVVIDVIRDPSSYPDWLVGAQHIHDVGEDWPAVGSSFIHQIGFGPLTTPGTTTVREVGQDRHLGLGAGMGPFGEASVDLEVHEQGDGCTVSMVERPVDGVVHLSDRLAGPAVRFLLERRNDRSLAKLEAVVRSRVGRPS